MNTGPGIAGPLELFATWVHEASHAVVGLLCGGSITRIDLSTDGSGVTGVRTGFPPSDFTQVAVGSAGYVGTVIIGALLLAAGRWVTASRAVLSVIGGFMVLSALLWMPSAFSFGLSVGLGVLFVVLVFLVPPRWIRFLVSGLGALTIVEGLLRIADVGDRTPDADLALRRSRRRNGAGALAPGRRRSRGRRDRGSHEAVPRRGEQARRRHLFPGTVRRAGRLG